MLLNRSKKFRLFISSLRFRVAFLSAILFLLSSLISFSALYWTARENAFAALDHTSRKRYEDILCVYLTGKRRRTLGVNTQLSELPNGVKEALFQKKPDFKPLLLFRKSVPESRNGREKFFFYSIAGSIDEKFFLYAFTRNGKFISSRQLSPGKNLTETGRIFQGWQYTGKKTFFFYRILDEKGEVLAGSSSRQAAEAFKRKKDYRIQKHLLNNGDSIECAISLANYRAEEEKIFSAIIFIFITLLPLSCIAGWLITALLTKGLWKIRDASVKIASGDLSQRVSEKEAPGSELKALVSAFNIMSSSNEKLISELRSVTDDIAHDLRTPITRIRANAELAVRKCSNKDCREAFGNIAEECENMILLISDMLEITRSESGVRLLNKEDFSLSALLGGLFENYLPTAEENRLFWQLSLPEKDVIFHGDKLKIQRVITNILDNTIKFLPPGEKFTLSLQEEKENILIIASDTGKGIPDEYKEKVFKRFFRMDSSRSSKGNGLGLAMVAAIIRQHNGKITLSDTENAPSGATFTIALPKDG